MRALATVWNEAVALLAKKELLSPGFDRWLHASKPRSFDGHRLEVEVPDAFTRDWVRSRYGPALESALAGLVGKPCELVLVTPEEPRPGNGEATQSRPSTPAPAEAEEGVPLSQGSLNPRYTFDSFVVGNSNRFAYSASLGAVSHPGTLYNPLFIYGGVGLGKTHLMQAVANQFLLTRLDMKVLYVTTEAFTNDLVESLQKRSMPEFRSRYRSVDALLVDDVHFAAGKESTQEEFFHTFNALHEAGRQIVLASDRPPHEIPKLEERLRSRFAWGLLADIQPPDYETRLAILRKRCESQEIPIPDEVLLFIADQIRSNIRVLEGALRRVATAAKLARKTPTPELAAEALRDLSESQRRPLTVERIQEIVAEHFSLPITELRGKSRTRDVAFARQVAMLLARQLTQASLPQIGQHFGGRDHSTVMHAIDKIQQSAQEDARVSELLRHLRQRLGE